MNLEAHACVFYGVILCTACSLGVNANFVFAMTCFGRIECGWALFLVFHDYFGEILNFNVT